MVAALSLLVMLQALYWPFIRAAQTPIEWWHNLFLAEVGRYVGYPIWIVLFKSPFEDVLNDVFAWALVITWAAVLYWITGAAIEKCPGDNPYPG